MSEEYGLFISHRSEDREIARVLQGALELFSKFRLDSTTNIYVCESMPGGTDWRNWIDEKIAKSTILVFLYTEENADWRWCLYEIGLFHGARSHGRDKKVHMITLKNPTIEKPLPPIDQFQAYDANGAGITAFFKDLCFNGEFTEGVIFNKEFNAMMPRFSDTFEMMVNAFLLPKSETEYLARRIWFDLGGKHEDHGLRMGIEEALIDGDDATLEIVNASRGTSFRDLYAQFQRRGQAAWLDEIKSAWDEVRQNRRPYGFLSTFFTPNRNRYKPVISQIDKHRLTVKNEDSIIPKRLVAILVPCPEAEPASPNTAGSPAPDLFLSDWSTYFPWSIVRIRWQKKSGKFYALEDMIEEPVVCAINEAFSQLFDFVYPSILETEGPGAWTSQRLLEQVQDYVLPEHMAKLREDQALVSTRIILQERIAHAAIPLQFNERHPNPLYRNGVYLPCMIAKRIVGEQSDKHETFLLVVYIKDFYPLT